MQRFATITVIGRDKTGVIARTTNYLFEQNANIEALEEQVTRGQFSMTLQASWPDEEYHESAIIAGLNQLAKVLEMEIKLRPLDPGRRQRVAFLVTREPHCLDSLMAAFKSGELNAEPTLVISNHHLLEPLARQHGIPFVCVAHPDRMEAEKETLRRLEENEIDLVILARYMRILSPNFVWRYKNKIINIHPSLLPSFPGAQAYRQAYERGVKIIGVTAHFVTMDLDEGPIIAQDCFHVTPDMTLKEILAAGQKIESKVLVQAVQLYLNKRLDVHWGIVQAV